MKDDRKIGTERLRIQLVQKGVKRRNAVKGATRSTSRKGYNNIMPYGNKTQEKVLVGQSRLTHWKQEDKGPKKRKEVEDRSPEVQGNKKRKRRSPKPGKQAKTSKPSTKKPLESKQKKIEMDKVGEKQKGIEKVEEKIEEEGSISEEVKKLNPDLQRLFKLIDRTITPLRSDLTRLLLGNEKVSEHQRKIVMLEEENVSLKRKLKKVEKSQEKTKTKVDRIESRLLEGNVIMHGLEEGKEESSLELYERVVEAISYTVKGRNKKERMEAAKEISISTVKRVGRKNQNRKRPTVISFVYKADALNLLEHKKKLQQGIYVDKEYPEEVEERRRYLRPILRAARQNPKYKGLCRMEEDVLVINSMRYTKENLHKLLKNIDRYHSTSKRNKDVIGFFGELNPFSNFHEVPLEIDGIIFHSTEQWIQYQKAKLFGDNEIGEKIMKTTRPIECKKLSYEIEDYNEVEWKENIEKLCYRGIKEKFVQHEWLRRLLLDTGNKCIVESTSNTIWGTGVALGDKDALNKNKWIGEGETGLMGTMLMKIREELKTMNSNEDQNEEQEHDTEAEESEDSMETTVMEEAESTNAETT